MVGRTWARASVLVLALVFVSAAAGALPRDRSSPSAPTSLRITATSATSLSLAWNASKDNSSNWWYCVQRSGAGCFRVDPPRTTFTYPLLWPGTSYSFTVVAIDSAGNRSAPSNAVTFTAPPDTTPPSAPVLGAVTVLPTRITLGWTKSVDNATQVSYTLLVNGTPSASNLIGSSGALLLYQSPATTYVFQVVARDAFGNAATSNTLTVTTPAATNAVAPTPPSNLRLSSESSPPEAWLDWDAASDDSDPSSQLMYEVYVNGALASSGIGNVEDIVYCAVTGPNRIAVRAVDTSGNASAFSNEIEFDC
jgi:chitodextrinase